MVLTCCTSCLEKWLTLPCLLPFFCRAYASGFWAWRRTTGRMWLITTGDTLSTRLRPCLLSWSLDAYRLGWADVLTFKKFNQKSEKACLFFSYLHLLFDQLVCFWLSFLETLAVKMSAFFPSCKRNLSERFLDVMRNNVNINVILCRSVALASLVSLPHIHE